MSKDVNNRDSGDYELFIKLYLANERRLYGYVRTLIPNWSDVDDIIQETAAVLWAKFDQFQRGTNFPAWALKIAHNQVLNYCKVRKKDKLYFSEAALESLAELCETRDSNLDQRLAALKKCLDQLKSDEQRLIEMRYRPGGSTKSVSQQTGKDLHVLYRLLNKIHTKLLLCVRRALAEGEAI
jgi:RNA polymerase sigma-70 factor (ECF subfamily)